MEIQKPEFEKIIKEQTTLLVKHQLMTKEEAQYYVENWERLQPEWESHKYQNAYALLNNYRDLRWAISDNIGYIAVEHGMDVANDLLYQNVDKLAQEISDAVGCEKDVTQLRSVIESAELSCKMLKYADRALEHIREYPDGGQTLFDVLYYTFISPKSAKALKEKKTPYFQYLKMGKTTYYDYRKKGLKLFSECLWGINKINVKDYVIFCMMAGKKLYHK